MCSSPPQAIRFPSWANFGLDGRVVAFSVGITVLRRSCSAWLRPFTRVEATVNRRDARGDWSGNTIGPAGVAPCLAGGSRVRDGRVLLVCGGLLMRAYDRVTHADPGFVRTMC